MCVPQRTISTITALVHHTSHALLQSQAPWAHKQHCHLTINMKSVLMPSTHYAPLSVMEYHQQTSTGNGTSPQPSLCAGFHMLWVGILTRTWDKVLYSSNPN